MRKIGSAMAAFTLAVGPWLALLASFGSPQSGAVLAAGDTLGWTGTTTLSAPEGNAGDPSDSGPFVVNGCTCREITVDASNTVTDSTVESGDARTENFNLTYVTAGYAKRSDAEVNVDQDANAKSGDAVAGQILGIDAGVGCAHITVHARNVVTDTEVRSGDAIAKNRNFVFLDPSLSRGDVKIDVDQKANAVSGAAVAGQIIGVQGGGGPCGGVTIDATNDVKNVEVETGDAVMDNWNLITQCKTNACLREISLLLHWKGGDAVRVCSDTGCEDMAVDDFVHALRRQARGTSIDEQLSAGDTGPTPTPNPDDDGLVDGQNIFGTPTPAPTATPTPTPTPVPAEAQPDGGDRPIDPERTDIPERP